MAHTIEVVDDLNETLDLSAIPTYRILRACSHSRVIAENVYHRLLKYRKELSDLKSKFRQLYEQHYVNECEIETTIDDDITDTCSVNSEPAAYKCEESTDTCSGGGGGDDVNTDECEGSDVSTETCFSGQQFFDLRKYQYSSESDSCESFGAMLDPHIQLVDQDRSFFGPFCSKTDGDCPYAREAAVRMYKVLSTFLNQLTDEIYCCNTLAA